MSTEPVFGDLTDREEAWIGFHLEAARTFGVDTASDQSISDYFDDGFERVRRGAEPPEAANMIVNVTGVLVGQYLSDRSTLRWRIVTDDFGTDLCLHDPATSYTLFPQSSAAKRWDAGEVTWVRPFCAWALESIPRPSA